jgi:hypothetical protein
MQPPPLPELGTELLQHGIGLLADQLVHEREGSGIAACLATSCMGRGAISSVVRRRRSNCSRNAWLTPNRAAKARCEPSC